MTSLDWFTTAGAMPLGFAAVAGVAAALGTRTTMLAASLVVLGLLAVALRASETYGACGCGSRRSLRRSAVHAPGQAWQLHGPDPADLHDVRSGSWAIRIATSPQAGQRSTTPAPR